MVLVLEEVPISIGRLVGHNNQRATKLDADYVLEYKNTPLAVIEAKSIVGLHCRRISSKKLCN